MSIISEDTVEYAAIEWLEQLGYQYIHFDSVTDPDPAHWIFLRAGGGVAWDIWRGLGLRLSIALRLGGLANMTDDNQFGVALDTIAGVFWAF